MSRNGTILRVAARVLGIAGRVLRRLLTGLSALLLLATLAAWGRGTTRMERFVAAREALEGNQAQRGVVALEWGGGEIAVTLGAWRADAAAARAAGMQALPYWKTKFTRESPRGAGRLLAKHLEVMRTAGARRAGITKACW